MARAGDVIANPVTGERIVFLQTAQETGGQLLQADLFVKPGGFVAAEHVHPHQEERFTVRSGILRIRIAAKSAPTGPETRPPCPRAPLTSGGMPERAS